MRRNVVLWTIVVIAVLVRLPALLNDGLWRDDAYVYVDVIAPTFGEFLHRTIEADWHPPLFFLLDYVWIRLAGTSEIALGFLPFAFSVATVPLVYLLGRDADSPRAGLLSAAIFALSPMAISYSDEYVYPFAGFTFALLAWRAIRARSEPMTAARFVALAAAALACVYSHYTALFVVPMLALWALCGPGSVRNKIAIAGAFAVGTLPFVVWLPVFLYQHRIGIPYEATTSLLGKVSFYVAALLLYVPVRPANAETVAVILFLAAIVVVARARRMKPDALALGVIFLLALAVVTADDLLAARYVLPCVAMICAFFGSTLAQLDALIEVPQAWQPLVWIVTGVLVALAGAGDVQFARTNSDVPKSGMRPMTRAEPLDPQTLYVVAPDYMAATFAYYARESPVAMRGFVRDDHPEIFRLHDYVADWNRPDAVDAAVTAIVAQAAHYRCIDVLVDAFGRDQAQLPYGKAWQLLHALERHYPLARNVLWNARFEPVDSYLLAVGRSRSGGAAANCR